MNRLNQPKVASPLHWQSVVELVCSDPSRFLQLAPSRAGANRGKLSLLKSFGGCCLRDLLIRYTSKSGQLFACCTFCCCCCYFVLFSCCMIFSYSVMFLHDNTVMEMV